MARKRLAPASPFTTEAPAPLPRAAGHSPIASVAGDSAAAAALAELSDSMEEARRTGRMVLDLPLDAVEEGYLVRDRILADEEEMSALVESLAARGQHTPIDVVDLGQGRYGLISGWRRLEALRRLEATGRGAGRVLALLRRPGEAPEAYLAMIEENEIRVGLSYYERARIAVKAAEAGVFEDERAALRHLFDTASRPKRSKIGSFMTIVQALDGALRFPAALGERAGLALARALEADPALARRLARQLEVAAPDTAEAELAVITGALEKAADPAPAKATPKAEKPETDSEKPGLVSVETLEDGSLRLSGAGVSARFRADLERWLARRR